MTSYLDLDYLKSTGAEPHWFGLGFIQLKLSETQRLHFYHPSLEPMVADEAHDHRYSFTSKVLKGALTNCLYSFRPDHEGDHESISVSCDPSRPSPDWPSSKGEIELVAVFTTTEGNVYSVSADTLHAVKKVFGKTVTVLTRDPPPYKPYARVVRHRGAPAICPFSDPKPTAELWEVIADVVTEPPPPYEALTIVEDYFFAQNKPGYHLQQIEKGVLGEASKIIEEAAEFHDAIQQGVNVMALVELSDMVGAVEAYLATKHPSLTLADLQAMAAVTRRAFENGRR